MYFIRADIYLAGKVSYDLERALRLWLGPKQDFICLTYLFIELSSFSRYFDDFFYSSPQILNMLCGEFGYKLAYEPSKVDVAQSPSHLRFATIYHLSLPWTIERLEHGLYLRKKIDEVKGEINQLENNLQFFSNVKDDTPLVKEVHKNIEKHRASLETWKSKLKRVRELYS